MTNDMIRFRVTPAERARIQTLADRLTAGNVSKLIKQLINEKEESMMKKLYIAEFQNEAAYDLRVCSTFDRDEAVAEAGTAWRYMTEKERAKQVLTVLAIDVPDSCATVQDAEDWLDRTDGWSGGGEVVLELGR